MPQQFVVTGQENVQIIFEDGSLSAELSVEELKSKIAPTAPKASEKKADESDSKSSSAKTKGK